MLIRLGLQLCGVERENCFTMIPAGQEKCLRNHGVPDGEIDGTPSACAWRFAAAMEDSRLKCPYPSDMRR